MHSLNRSSLSLDSFNPNFFCSAKRRILISEEDSAEGNQVLILLSSGVFFIYVGVIVSIFCLIVTFSENIGNKRSSPDYDDEDYDNDPFAPKKVAITWICYVMLPFSCISTTCLFFFFFYHSFFIWLCWIIVTEEVFRLRKVR